MVALNLVLLWILLLGILLLQWGIIRTLRRHDERFAQLDFSPPGGLEPGSAAPDFTVLDAAGDPVTRDEVINGRSVLAFMSGSCSACETHVPMLRDYIGRDGAALPVVVVVEGASEQADRLAGMLDGAMTVVRARPPHDEIIARYDVVAFPSYYIVTDTGMVEALHFAVEELPTAG